MIPFISVSLLSLLSLLLQVPKSLLYYWLFFVLYAGLICASGVKRALKFLKGPRFVGKRAQGNVILTP